MRNCRRYNRIYGLQLRNILLGQLFCFVLCFFDDFVRPLNWVAHAYIRLVHFLYTRPKFSEVYSHQVYHWSRVNTGMHNALATVIVTKIQKLETNKIPQNRLAGLIRITTYDSSERLNFFCLWNLLRIWDCRPFSVLKTLTGSRAEKSLKCHKTRFCLLSPA